MKTVILKRLTVDKIFLKYAYIKKCKKNRIAYN